MSLIVVTGTGTDVGKTVATAALAGCLASTGQTVAVVKPAQTGVGELAPGDLAEVTRLTGVGTTYEYARYPDPLSPHHAAALSHRPLLQQADVADRIYKLADEYDHVIVEGAGGLLVPIGDGWTIFDLALDFDEPEIVLVVNAGLGTLNHTALSRAHLEDGGLTPHIVIGSWPRNPGLSERCNVVDLSRMSEGGQLAGVLPAGLPAATDFTAAARAAIGPRFAGTFDAAAFRAAVRPEGF
jgi:dethiobiotin synthetase